MTATDPPPWEPQLVPEFDDLDEPGAADMAALQAWNAEDGPQDSGTPAVPFPEQLRAYFEAMPQTAHDVEAEIAVLGAMLLDPQAGRDCAAELTRGSFYRGEHGDVFDALVTVQSEIDAGTREAAAADAIALKRELQQRGIWERVGGSGFISRVLASVPSAANAAYYASVVASHARTREEFRLLAELTRSRTHQDRQHARTRLEQHWSEPVGQSGRRTFASMDALELIEADIPDYEQLVGHHILFRGGVTVMVAPYKAGKSMATLGLCCDLALAVAVLGGGATWLGLDVLDAGVVHLYSAEGGPKMLRKRLLDMHGPRPSHELRNLRCFASRPTPQLDDPEDLDAVFAQAEADGAVLIVFDPLGRFWSMEDEADPKLARDLMDAVQRRAQDAYQGRGIAVLIVHHDTKTGGQAGTRATAGRGSGRFADDVDALINLKVVEGEEGVVDVVALPRNDVHPPTRRFELDPATLRFTKQAQEVQERARSSRLRGAAKQRMPDTKLLAALARACDEECGAVSIERWAESAGVSRTQLGRRLKPNPKTQDPGLISSSGAMLEVLEDGRGPTLYALTDEGRTLLGIGEEEGS